MSALSSALIVIFVLTITSLSALYFFVTRHQRRFRRQSRLTTATPTDHESTTTTESAYYVPSKELLYFFWWNNQNRPVGHTPQTTFQEPRPDPSAPADVEIDVLKLIAALQGHTRSPLFTIIEEQKTETTDQSHNTQHINDNRTSLSSSDEDIIGRVSLSGSLGLVGDSAAADVADSPVITSDEEVEEEEEEMTTPNASPPYLTPSDSPLHDYSNIDSTFHVHNFIANSRGRRGSRRSRRPRAELQAKDDDLDKAAPPFEESEETGEKVGPRPVSETP